jgi:REP element-mobilizing transposase RayT
MSSHVYHDIYLHLNWHTKEDYPSLTGHVEDLTRGIIQAKCQAMKGVYVHAIGGTDTHIHVALGIEPFVTISDLVQELKGHSAFEVNKRTGRKVLEWQRGYGVVSFGQNNLDWVLEYVRDQREHHACGKANNRLEAHETPEGAGKPG